MSDMLLNLMNKVTSVYVKTKINAELTCAVHSCMCDDYFVITFLLNPEKTKPSIIHVWT
jgi:hypothetical protein